MSRGFWKGLFQDWGVAFLVVFSVFGLWGWLTAPTAPPVGPAPAFALPDLEDRVVRLDDIDDDVIVLNFWFTACPPCRVEIPELSAYQEQNPDVSIYGISVDTNMSSSRLSAMSERLGVRYTVLHDAEVEVARAYGITVFPTTLVVRDGRILASWVGAVDRRSLAALVDGVR